MEAQEVGHCGNSLGASFATLSLSLFLPHEVLAILMQATPEKCVVAQMLPNKSDEFCSLVLEGFS